MNDHQIALVRRSFAAAGLRSPDFATRFYSRLFQLDPTTRPLFPTDLTAQQAKLMTMLGTIVGGLDRLNAYLPAIEALAVRHVGYGVSERHYMTVGAALIDTLGASLQDEFTEEVREAWLLAYGVLSMTMIAAVRRGNRDAIPRRVA